MLTIPEGVAVPNFERNLKQTATYWAPASTDIFGKVTYSAPQERACRWEDRQELFRDKAGQETTSRSKIFMALDADLDGYLYLGTSAASDPTTVAGAWEIRQIARLPDLRNLKTLYVAIL